MQKINRRNLLQGAALAIGLRAASPVLIAISAYSSQSLADDDGAHNEKASILNPTERAMVDVLAELIIPETETPGAGAAGVPDFIDLMVSQWYRTDDRKRFITGLRDLNHHCLISFGSSFLECGEKRQIIALEDLEQNVVGTISDDKTGGVSERAAVASDDWALWNDHPLDGKDFFDQIKSLTVLGYYTSEIGIESELIYEPVPGSYDGSFDFHSVGKHFTS